MSTSARQAAVAAERVSLAIAIEPVALDLYGVRDIVLDEKATLRRVALFFRGTGRYTLSADERTAAIEVIRGRFEEQYG